MDNNSQNLNIDRLKTESEMRGRWIVQQELGRLRSVASQLRVLDEEHVFSVSSASWIRGIKNEITKLFGPERGTEILDIWHRKQS